MNEGREVYSRSWHSIQLYGKKGTFPHAGMSSLQVQVDGGKVIRANLVVSSAGYRENTSAVFPFYSDGLSRT